MAYSAQQVRAKTRTAVKRREEEIEQEETEGGELNLIPYLDIVTNLMLYLLVSISAGAVLGQINTTLPDRAAAATTTPPQVKPEDQPLDIWLGVERTRAYIFSLTNPRFGSVKQPYKVFPLAGQAGAACDGGYMCISGECDGATLQCNPPTGPVTEQAPVFDFRAINAALFEIAKNEYGNKVRGDKTYPATIMADSTIPYSTIISAMGALRCKLPKLGEPGVSCLMPSDDAELKKKADPISLTSGVFDPARATYNPETMALFPEIRFSTGFE